MGMAVLGRLVMVSGNRVLMELVVVVLWTGRDSESGMGWRERL
jgi:hypothetical protein